MSLERRFKTFDTFFYLE
jgi:nitroreductase